MAEYLWNRVQTGKCSVVRDPGDIASRAVHVERIVITRISRMILARETLGQDGTVEQIVVWGWNIPPCDPTLDHLNDFIICELWLWISCSIGVGLNNRSFADPSILFQLCQVGTR